MLQKVSDGLDPIVGERVKDAVVQVESADGSVEKGGYMQLGLFVFGIMDGIGLPVGDEGKHAAKIAIIDGIKNESGLTPEWNSPDSQKKCQIKH